jgi:two-component system, NtrC family, response regulator AlgB
MAAILVVDDDFGIRAHLIAYLRELGHEVEPAADALAGLELVDRRAFDVVLSDVRMAGMDGFAMLRELRRRYPETGVVLMTAYATVPDAVEAIRGGAYDYLVKPFSLEQVGLVLGRLLEVQTLRRENRTLRRAVDPPPLLESRNARMRQVLDLGRRAAESDATILVTGESGVGKNVIAAAIHRWSPRAAEPFVTIACTTLAEHLLESELFGHVRGAFTGAWRDKPGRLEAAARGTAFLDEIGELTSEVQAKLLRFLEERSFEPVGGGETITVETRIIAATSRHLGEEVPAGRFRDDLFYRLNVVALEVPSLRERREDLRALTDHVLTTLAVRHARPDLTITPAARRAIDRYRWPGNVRELINALERAVVVGRGNVIDAENLPDRVLAPGAAQPAPSLAAVHDALEDVERVHVQRILAESATLEEAALRLGINPTTLWRKRRRWGLE